MCGCRACTLLFDRGVAGGGNYRLVPGRRVRLAHLEPAAGRARKVVKESRASAPQFVLLSLVCLYYRSSYSGAGEVRAIRFGPARRVSRAERAARGLDYTLSTMSAADTRKTTSEQEYVLGTHDDELIAYWARPERVFLIVEEARVEELRQVLQGTEPLLARPVGSREVFLFSNR